eukprot:CAMPEP_0118939590 /NCGR_PEP_ID=MMETSP1169-20130426/29293_1 /TAXON_ID=36882 /ORGANISM="Pyramimonas obovata, Strain CCMP722" /LENGTH=257 /DNA_ID=CAMNT_0006883893 /DNA_START=230 /DNA_END=999 /DNA_ORIENTATION=-
MALMAMPIIVINLGGEMLYILDQRLRAQNIPPEKSVKVLHDVVRTMFSTKFIAEVIKPAPIYSNASTRQIFERLAHSSIMRLSESSMDKLYDLMTMGLKYQLLSCKKPNEILQVTINHLQSIRTCIIDPSVIDLVTSCEEQLNMHFKHLRIGDWSQLRQALIGFFHDRRIKVSLFLQEGIQSADGRICLPPACSSTSEHGTLGKAQEYTAGGAASDVYSLSLFEAPFTNQHPVSLGCNLYGKDRPRAQGRSARGSTP